MITLGFTLIGRGIWTSGLGYLRLTASSVRQHVSDGMRVRIIVSPEEFKVYEADLTSSFTSEEIVIDQRIEGAGRGERLLNALSTARDRSAEKAFLDAGCNCVFESAIYLGSRFSLPVMAWFPDFQHRAMPQLFSRQSWWRRDLGFRLQAATRPVVILSSEAARSDFEQHYGRTKAKVAVVRFAAPVDVTATLARSVDARARHGVPEQFFFLPNQFFAHKNHAIVIQALLRATSRGQINDILPIIATGSPLDPRDPDHFNRLQEKLRAAGVGNIFRHLGLIEYGDVLALAASARALINPSLFEGWSTPIEEAKALGVPLILSDLPVLREQAPQANFFSPHDADALLAHLLSASKSGVRLVLNTSILEAEQSARSKSHALALLAAAQMAVATA